MLVGVEDLERGVGRLRFKKLRADREVFFVAQTVAAECDVCLTKMLRRSRGSGRTAQARQMAIYLSHVLLRRPQDVLADLFVRDRTTISHAVQSMEDRRDDPRLDALIERIERHVAPYLPAEELDHAA